MTAHSRLSLPLLAAALVALVGSGCVINSTPTPQGRRGDITFTWNFANRPCFQVPDVVQVAVQIPGETLQNNGVYGCNNGGTDGIKLLNFRPGIYSFTISAQNQAGAVIYQGTGQITVDGNVALDVTLTPTQNATGSVYVTWTLPVGTPVTCQYVPAVDISIDNGAYTTVNCADGATSPGVLLQNLSVGRHTIDISARDTQGLYYYRAINSFDAFAGGATSQQFSLQWIVGSLPLKWSFSNGVTQLNCAQAGVFEVQITLRDSQNQDSTFTVPCLNNGVQGYQVPYVYYGNYQIFLAATGTGNVVYRSSLAVPPTATVVEGQFPPVDAQTPAILMTP